jgi:hypothetical protein
MINVNHSSLINFSKFDSCIYLYNSVLKTSKKYNRKLFYISLSVEEKRDIKNKECKNLDIKKIKIAL